MGTTLPDDEQQVPVLEQAEMHGRNDEVGFAVADSNERNERDADGDQASEDEGEGDEEDMDGATLAKNLSEKLSQEPVHIRVHDIQIKGNTKTKDIVIEAQLDEVRNVTTMQELLQESLKANARLRAMGVFDKCIITVDSGPEELPGTANVIVEVEESKRPFSGDVGIFSKPETRAWTLDGTVKWRNLLGYGETIDGTGSYGWDTTTELSAGVSCPRFNGWRSSLVSRVNILTQDWQKNSSYRERLKGLSVGLLNDDTHDITYNLTWRELEDPSKEASSSIRMQLGHRLLSSVRYTYNLDNRDSLVRPTQGYAFISSSQVAGLGSDSRLERFVRQELEFRFSLPLGIFNSALNAGVAGGIILPWGEGYLTKQTPIRDRFFMGGHSSLLGNMKGPSALLGFRTRGIGPTERRQSPRASNPDEKPRAKDTLGGDFAISSFADLSFDLPFRMFREHGVHGHSFICAGTLLPLTGENREMFSFQKMLSSFRASAGAGLVVPTKLFRLELNYCCVLRKMEQDRVKRGFQISFSSPH